MGPVKTKYRKMHCKAYSAFFLLLVAGTGIEPVSRGYEPRELPLLYPAIFLHNYFNEDYLTSEVMRAMSSCELPLLYPAIFLNVVI